MSASLAILVPTKGTGDLPFLFHSIKTQELIPEDEVIIIGDGPQTSMRQLVDACGPPFRYIEGPETGDWGHSQLNLGLDAARADFITPVDDDDAYLPNAFSTIRRVLTSSVPHIFRFYTNDLTLVWDRLTKGKIQEKLIGSHNLVVPNVKSHLGRFAARYRGDFDWTESTLDCYPRRTWVWHEPIICRQRPNKLLLDWPVAASPQLQAAFDQLGGPRDVLWSYVFTPRAQKSTYIGWSAGWKQDEALHVTFSLGAAYRGEGYGKLLGQHAIDAAMGDCHSTLLATETSLISLYKSLGWDIQGEADGRVRLFYRSP